MHSLPLVMCIFQKRQRAHLCLSAFLRKTATDVGKTGTYTVKGLSSGAKGGERMDDLQIIGLFFARSEEALRETQAKYGKLCFRIAQNILGSDADAEECVNDAYLSLWNTIPPQRPLNLAAYVARLVRNISLNRLRFNSAAKRNVQAEVSLSELADTLPDHLAQAELDKRQLGKLISAFLWREPEHSRNVFIRRYFFLDSIQDIAARYSYSESKVKSMLFRTRNRLRNYLLKEGYEL